MKKIIILILVCFTSHLSAQKKAYGDGEWFKFRIHYGPITAGYATLKVEDAVLNNKDVFHVQGQGHTTGITKLLFHWALLKAIHRQGIRYSISFCKKD